MRYLLDTCIVSELVKVSPEKKVVDWIRRYDEENYYLSSLTFGEIYKGIFKLPRSKRKENLYHWLEHGLKERFKNRILSVDLKIARIWGEIQGALEAKGQLIPVIDGLIAATGLAYDLMVVTRNTKDMEPSGVLLFNPWD